MALLGLGQFAAWIPTYLAVERGTCAQARAIHFALSYVVLSECEFFRVCWEWHHGNRRFNLESLLAAEREASNDADFCERRDFGSFDHCIPKPPAPRPEDDWMSIRRIVDFVAPGLLAYGFQLACGCFNYPVKRLVNPNPQGDGFPLFFKGFYQVFFTPRYWILGLLDLILQRPIRVLHGMLFWLARGWVERAWNTWYS
ncbi:hypothetical protein P171DRAFT_483453 [Karstenula rhodostoma CBS 690.94]|uniref:Uncharacterized protein n=1 Tax=Karstenula rhodostoma CBS 690.94 TaxID=1392251 RepID=A0A9P4UBX1_9PLEO|nr:hypothetical protein P171DRAFT_483453 [Karstenula rhodostoma CBS 690.94]